MALTWRVQDPRYPWRPLWHAVLERRQLERLVELCHPTRNKRPILFWLAHPTIVISHPNGIGLIGYQSFSVAHDLLYGVDMGVDPAFRGQGLGKILMWSRLRVAKMLATITKIAGQTQVDNHPMIRIFEEAGMTLQARVENYYTDIPTPADALIYAGDSKTWEGA